MLLDVSKVLDHAHMILGTIPFIQFLQSFAGKAFARKTKFKFTALYKFAILYLASWYGNGLPPIRRPAPPAFVFIT